MTVLSVSGERAMFSSPLDGLVQGHPQSPTTETHSPGNQTQVQVEMPELWGLGILMFSPILHSRHPLSQVTIRSPMHLQIVRQ